MKYIGLDVTMGPSGITRRIVVAFPNDLTHAIVAPALRMACSQEWPGSSVTVETAGFAEVTMLSSHGKSESLRLKSNKDDARAFNTSDYSGHVS